MVLNISGIDRLKHNFFHNREVLKITLAERFGKESGSYVFHFGQCPITVLKPTNRMKQWGDPFEVHLCRYPKHNKYELFVMGLHGVTCQELTLDEVKNFSEFVNGIELVIGRAKRYWEEE